MFENNSTIKFFKQNLFHHEMEDMVEYYKVDDGNIDMQKILSFGDRPELPGQSLKIAKELIRSSV